MCFAATLLCSVRLFGQNSPETISGTVVDAAANQPVFHALVRLTGQSASRFVLTDSSGHFSFPQASPDQITLTVTKPGYFPSRRPGDSTQLHVKPEDAAEPVLLRLYPEAILTGTISDPDGNPLPRISVEALRATIDDLGRHWIVTAVTRSDARGQFRLPVAAGDYRVRTDLSHNSGASAVMPTALPDPGESGIRLQPGEQRDLDLHPLLAPLVAIDARVNTPVDEIGTLIGLLGDGTSFPIPFTPSGALDFTAKLPAGSYILQTRPRGFGSDGISQASVAVFPSAKQPVALTLQFVPVATIPVEILLDQAAVAAASAAGQTLTPPNARSLSLALEPNVPQPNADADYLRTSYHRGDTGITFTVPPGSYRLRAQRNYGWFITSALYGGTDLLGHDLTVAAGSGSTPLQIMVSNQLATVSGKVTLNGAPAACWIYLVATIPSATPVLTLRSGEDGTFTQTIPPGSYRAVAFASRRTPDPEGLMQATANAAEVTAAAGEKATVTLEAAPDAEGRP